MTCFICRSNGARKCSEGDCGLCAVCAGYKCDKGAAHTEGEARMVAVAYNTTVYKCGCGYWHLNE